MLAEDADHPSANGTCGPRGRYPPPDALRRAAHRVCFVHVQTCGCTSTTATTPGLAYHLESAVLPVVSDSGRSDPGRAGRGPSSRASVEPGLDTRETPTRFDLTSQ